MTVITYENLLRWSDFSWRDHRFLDKLTVYPFLSFQDALHYLINAYSLRGKTILLPAFYCPATILDMQKHGLQVQLCKMDHDHFDIDMADFHEKLQTKPPDIVLIYNVYGKNSVLYRDTAWLAMLPSDTILISDFAHSLLPNHPIRFLNQRHFYIDSTRKTTSLMMAHLVFPPGEIIQQAYLVHFSVFKMLIRTLFFIKSVFLRVATRFNLPIFSTLGMWCYMLHDRWIGSKEAAYTGTWWDNFFYRHIDFVKLRKLRQQHYQAYLRHLAPLAKQGDIALFSLPDNEEENLCYFPLRIVCHAHVDPLVKQLQRQGIWAEILWEMDMVSGMHPADLAWAKSIVVLPYTVRLTPRHVEVVAKVMQAYFASATDTIRQIMRNAPLQSTVLAILYHRHGRVIQFDQERACLNAAIFYYIEGPFQQVFAESLLTALKPNSIIISSHAEWYYFLEKQWVGRTKRVMRYVYQWGKDASYLTPYLTSSSESWQVAPLTAALVQELLQLEWAEGVFDAYSGISDFLSRGFGYCIRQNERIVSLCVSFASSVETVEVEVDTDPVYQKMGFATIVSAHFIAEALRRGMAPVWDATNAASAKIAEKLGFKQVDTYEALTTT